MNSRQLTTRSAEGWSRRHGIYNRNRDLTEDLDELRLATIRGHKQVIENAIDKGISVNQILKGGWTPLMYASSVGNPEIVTYLLQRGADPNFHKELFTPVMAVCVSTRENEGDLVDCLERLLESGAMAGAAERHRITPLMFAALTGHPRLVAILAAKRCPLDAQDAHGWTALFWAVNQGKSDVVQLLVSLGAKIDIKDRKGQTAIDLAKSKRIYQIVHIFENKNDMIWKDSPAFVNHVNNGGLEELLCQSNNIDNKNNARMFAKELDKVLEMKLLYQNSNNCTGQNGNYCKMTNCDIVGVNKPFLKEPYSVRYAIQAMRWVLLQIKNTHQQASFIRLRLQGHPLNYPSEYSASSLSMLQDLSYKSLNQAHLLYTELNFLKQYTKQMDGSNGIISADVIIQPKHSPTSKIVSCLVLILVSVFTFQKLKYILSPGKTYF